MKIRFAALLICSHFTLATFGQNKLDSVSITGRWTDKQSDDHLNEWLFHPGGNFTEISYWGGNQPTLRGNVFKGKYTIDTAKNLITIRIDYVINLKTNKTEKLDSADYVDRFKILSLTESELRLMELKIYERAIKISPIDFSTWNTRLLVRSNKFIYRP